MFYFRIKKTLVSSQYFLTEFQSIDCNNKLSLLSVVIKVLSLKVFCTKCLSTSPLIVYWGDVSFVYKIELFVYQTVAVLK